MSITGPAPIGQNAFNDGRMLRDERKAAGKALRDSVPHEAHSQWTPGPARRDPVEMVIEGNKGRIEKLIPIRHGRMMISPFTFYRGTAAIMAADLEKSPVTGITTQICGDCHLLNMGAYATPERRVVVDINDFDETMPGPWEWDVKRLAASFVLAARSNGFGSSDQREAALSSVRSYRTRMREYARMKALDVWYARIDIDQVAEMARENEAVSRLRKRLAKATARTVAEDDFPKMVEQKDGELLIKEVLPLIFHHPELDQARTHDLIQRTLADYRTTLADDRRVLYDRYRLRDFSMKVVGVGSVGTFCSIMLMTAEDDDPIFLQLKEARQSVLEPYLPQKSVYSNQGQRVVVGQRLMQSASDIFLGWTQGHGKEKRHFYLRQLRDIKVKPMVEVFTPTTMVDYGAVCGWALARAHARAGDAAIISGYLGKSDSFDQAVARFASKYADQAERDHTKWLDAIRSGRIEAMPDQV